MIALTIPEREVRGFMEHLLRRETFDFFDARAAAIQTFARFDIEGQMPASQNASPNERCPPSYNKWRQLRPFMHNLVTSGGKPGYMKVVLSYPKEQVETEYPDAKALFVNLIYDNSRVTVISGASMKTFSLDKSVERLWDDFLKEFLQKSGLRFIEEPIKEAEAGEGGAEYRNAEYENPEHESPEYEDVEYEVVEEGEPEYKDD